MPRGWRCAGSSPRTSLPRAEGSRRLSFRAPALSRMPSLRSRADPETAMAEHVSVTREGEVVLVRLNRPDKKNAMTGAMYGALVETFDAADWDAAGAIVITGSGGSFMAGNDISDLLARA